MEKPQDVCMQHLLAKTAMKYGAASSAWLLEFRVGNQTVAPCGNWMHMSVCSKTWVLVLLFRGTPKHNSSQLCTLAVLGYEVRTWGMLGYNPNI